MDTVAGRALGRLLFAVLVSSPAFLAAQPVPEIGFRVNYGEALAAPELGGVRISLMGRAMSACGVQYHTTPRRQSPNVLVIEISTSPVVGGPGCNFVPVDLRWLVPFPNLDDGLYEVVVLYTNPPEPLEMLRFAFGVPVAAAVPMEDPWIWTLLALAVLALAWRPARTGQCMVMRGGGGGGGGSRSVIGSSARQGGSSSSSGSNSQL